MKRLFAASVLCVSLLGQSSDELRRKYGEPISETFVVQPGISVTATYGTNRQIAELSVCPRSEGPTPLGKLTLTQERARAVVDEIVPKSTRGKYIIGMFENMTCFPTDACSSGGVLETYEKLTIHYNDDTRNRPSCAVVTWNSK